MQRMTKMKAVEAPSAATASDRRTHPPTRSVIERSGTDPWQQPVECIAVHRTSSEVSWERAKCLKTHSGQKPKRCCMYHVCITFHRPVNVTEQTCLLLCPVRCSVSVTVQSDAVKYNCCAIISIFTKFTHFQFLLMSSGVWSFYTTCVIELRVDGGALYWSVCSLHLCPNH